MFEGKGGAYKGGPPNLVSVLLCAEFSVSDKLSSFIYHSKIYHKYFVQLGLNEADMNKSISILIY